MNIVVGLIIFALFLVGMFLLLGYGRTYVVERQPEQTIFTKGAADVSGLDGDYVGVAHGYSGTTWQGKTVFGDTHSGINRFKYETGLATKYPFKIFTAKALRDDNKEIIKLDYNQLGNPWWLKYIVDEMVQVGPQEYLGKVHVKISKHIVFTLGYFSLSK